MKKMLQGFGTLRPDLSGLALTDHITTDKRLRYASPKLPSANSFIHKALNEIGKHRE